MEGRSATCFIESRTTVRERRTRGGKSENNSGSEKDRKKRVMERRVNYFYMSWVTKKKRGKRGREGKGKEERRE